MRQSYKYCHDKVAISGSNFYYSFLFLPPKQREAITAIYAFCREVDDIVDECRDATIAGQKIVWWSSEIDRVFNGTPQHPISIELASAVGNFGLPRIWFDEILQGMAMNLRYHGYQSFEDLNLYCHCVSSTVSMLTATIFGYSNPNTLDYAKKLGMAIQLINIIQNIGEDARSGRIYIPEQELAAFGITPDELLSLQVRTPKQLTTLLTKLAFAAREYYTAALHALTPEDRPLQRSGIIMAAIYFSILKEIERNQFMVLNQKITITPLRKLWIAWRTK
jgi:phytoene synthase